MKLLIKNTSRGAFLVQDLIEKAGATEGDKPAKRTILLDLPKDLTGVEFLDVTARAYGNPIGKELQVIAKERGKKVKKIISVLPKEAFEKISIFELSEPLADEAGIVEWTSLVAAFAEELTSEIDSLPDPKPVEPKKPRVPKAE